MKQRATHFGAAIGILLLSLFTPAARAEVPSDPPGTYSISWLGNTYMDTVGHKNVTEELADLCLSPNGKIFTAGYAETWGGGGATCMKSASGEIIWQERVGGNFAASPVASPGRIYFVGDNGETTVIEAGPEFKILAKNRLDEKVQASPALSQGQIFIRTDRRLFCVGAK